MSTTAIPAATHERLIASFIVLLLGRLTNWNFPIGDGPVYLTGEQAASLAAEGVRLLAEHLPKEAAQQVTAAVARIARPPQPSTEEVLLHMGKLGAETIIHNPGAAPGCCIQTQRGLVCVR